MASTIQLKTGTGSAVPSSLTQGEVAINIDNGLIYYGSGSVNSVKQLETFTNITASGNISASGTIIATGAIQAESVTIGSGDSSVTGNITVAGNIEANGNIVGDTQTAIIGIKQITTSDFISGSQLISHTNITASNNISASGYVYAQRVFLNNNDTLRYSTANSGLYVNGGIQTIGNSTFGNANVDTHTFNGHITASVYNISASGIIANSLAGTLSTAAQPEITSLGTLSALQTSGDVTLGSGNSIVNSDSDETIISNGSTGFNIGQSDYPLTIVSNVTASGNIKIGGNLHLSASANGHITASGNISASGTIVGSNLSGTNTGDQSLVHLAITSSISGAFTAASSSFSTRVTANDAKLTANTTNVTNAGALMDSELSDITAVKAINQGLTTTSNVQFNNVTGSGIISASAFVGTPVIIHEWAGFLNGFTADQYYYGHSSYGPTHHIWNGALSSEPTDMGDIGASRHGLFFHHVPFNLTRIGIQGGGQSNNTGTDTIQFHLYKTTPANSIAANNSVLTKIGVAETDNIDNANHHFTANLVTNDSCNAGDALVLLMRPTGTSAQIRWNYTIYGYSNG